MLFHLDATVNLQFEQFRRNNLQDIINPV